MERKTLSAEKGGYTKYDGPSCRGQIADLAELPEILLPPFRLWSLTPRKESEGSIKQSYLEVGQAHR